MLESCVDDGILLDSSPVSLSPPPTTTVNTPSLANLQQQHNLLPLGSRFIGYHDNPASYHSDVDILHSSPSMASLNGAETNTCHLAGPDPNANFPSRETVASDNSNNNNNPHLGPQERSGCIVM